MRMQDRLATIQQTTKEIKELLVNRNWLIELHRGRDNLTFTLTRKESYKSLDELHKSVKFTITNNHLIEKNKERSFIVSNVVELTNAQVGHAKAALGNLLKQEIDDTVVEKPTADVAQHWRNRRRDLICYAILKPLREPTAYAITSTANAITLLNKENYKDFCGIGIREEGLDFMLYVKMEIKKRQTITEISNIAIIQVLYEECKDWRVIYDDRIQKEKYLQMTDLWTV